MIKTRNITCTVCPTGCKISVEHDDCDMVSIKGNKCKRGIPYAISEVTHPMRTLTTTARITGATIPLIPVKSEKPLPRELLFECMKEINMLNLNAPIHLGDVIIKNILDTGVDIVTTRTLK